MRENKSGPFWFSVIFIVCLILTTWNTYIIKDDLEVMRANLERMSKIQEVILASER